MIEKLNLPLFYDKDAPRMYCQKCNWKGNESQLPLCKDEDGEIFPACPNCITDDYLDDVY